MPGSCRSMLLLAALLLLQQSHACTEIILKDQCSPGATISGRTLSFPAALGPSVVLAPVGAKLALLDVAQGTPPPGIGSSVPARFAFSCVSHRPAQLKQMFLASDPINQANHQICSDGLNEKGLSVGLLYQDGTKDMPRYTGNSAKKMAVNFIDVTTYLLARYSSIADVTRDLASNLQVVWNPAYDSVGRLVTMGQQAVPPMHITVHDASGGSLVIQIRDNVVEVLPNPLGVFDNSPFLQDHLEEYDAWLKKHNYSSTQPAVGMKWVMPGDYSSSSRFIRMAMLKTAALGACWATEAGGEQQLLSPGYVAKGYPAASPTMLAVVGILQSVYLPRGVDDDGGVDDTQPSNKEVTPFSTLRDHQAAVYYYRTGNSLTYRSISLRAVDWSRVRGLVEQELLPPETPWVQDVTRQFETPAAGGPSSSKTSGESSRRPSSSRNSRRLLQ